MTFNIARTLGPAAAAVTIATLGIPAAFAINAASYGFFLVGLLLIKAPRQERAESAGLLESLRLIRSEPRLLAFLLIVAVVGFASDPINTLHQRSPTSSAIRTRTPATSSASSARERWWQRSRWRGVRAARACAWRSR